MRIPLDQMAPRAGAPVAVSGLGGLARGGVPLWLPLPFLLTGIAGGAIFGIAAPFILPEALLAPGYPHVLALVHTVTLGWLTMIIMGASLQLTPVILVAPLRAVRLAPAQYPIYTLGVALLIGGFWASNLTALIAGGALTLLAVGHYAVILSVTLARAPNHPLSARYLAASIVYLCIVVSLGFTAALNFRFGFLGAGLLRLLLAHVTLGIVGWLTTTLIGVSYTLTRLFALAHGHPDRLGRIVFWPLNAGIIALALGFGLDWYPLDILGGLSLIGAVWLFAIDYRRMLLARMRRPLDITQYHAIAAVGYLVVTITAGVIVSLVGAASEPILVALGLAALVGWLGQSTLGYLYKITPFLIWQSRYGPLAGRQPVPLMRDLIHQRAAWVSFWLINVALPLAAVCAALDWPAALQVAAAALGAGLVIGAANIFGVLIPRAAPQRAAASA